uniref:Uncharacterized protein n=1 Tax=Anguilla anguilla TaxID=7936 RepID=A0A0E9QAF5_ANGAN
MHPAMQNKQGHTKQIPHKSVS